MLARRRQLMRVLPFFALLLVGCLYLSLQGEQGYGSDFQFALQSVVPFFKFFRVASQRAMSAVMSALPMSRPTRP